MAISATETKVIVSTVVSTDTRDQLLQLAERGDRTLSAEIRRAVTAHLKHIEKGEAA